MRWKEGGYLGLDVPDVLGAVQTDLQDPVVSPGLGSEENNINQGGYY